MIRRFAVFLLTCALVCGCDSEKEIHPGIDFPAAWLPDGIDKAPFVKLEQSSAQFDLISKKSDFRRWCEKNGYEVDEKALESLTLVAGQWIATPSHSLSSRWPGTEVFERSARENGKTFNRQTTWDDHSLECEWHLNANAAMGLPSIVLVKVPRDFKPHQVEGSILKAWSTLNPQAVLGVEHELVKAATVAVETGFAKFHVAPWSFELRVHDRGDHFLCGLDFRVPVGESPETPTQKRLDGSDAN